MADVTHIRIEEIEALQGFERVSMRRAAAALGVSSFGISIEELAPGADEYPEHDHSEDGLGGEMFAKRPQQLGQEEVYVALRGSGTLEADGEKYRLDPGTSVSILASQPPVQLSATATHCPLLMSIAPTCA